MISGTDTSFRLPAAMPQGMVLDLCARRLLALWPHAILQDSIGQLHAFAACPFGLLSELFVYQDQAALDAWERDGLTEAHANRMVHLLVDGPRGSLTIVVDDPAAFEPWLTSLADMLSHGTPYL